MKLSMDSNLIQGFVAAPVKCILDFFPTKPPTPPGKYQNGLKQPELVKQRLLGQLGDLKSPSDKFQHCGIYSSE